MSGALAKKRKQPESDPSEDDGEEKTVILPDIGMSRDAKFELIEAGLPVDNEEALLNIIRDPDGPELIEMAMELAANKALDAKKFTYDTSEKGNAVASQFGHLIFSKKYMEKYKLFDPRPNYKQREGTAMSQEVYDWFKGIMIALAYSYHERNNLAGKFFWNEFYDKLRKVWRWSRGNEARRAKNTEEAQKNPPKQSK